MNLTLFLLKNNKVILYFFLCSVIAGFLFSLSLKEKEYTAYSYFSDPRMQVILKDPQLYKNFKLKNFSVKKVGGYQSKYYSFSRKADNEEIAKSELDTVLRRAHFWKPKIVLAEKIRVEENNVNRFKSFLMFLGLTNFLFCISFYLFKNKERILEELSKEE